MGWWGGELWLQAGRCQVRRMGQPSPWISSPSRSCSGPPPSSLELCSLCLGLFDTLFAYQFLLTSEVIFFFFFLFIFGCIGSSLLRTGFL